MKAIRIGGAACGLLCLAASWCPAEESSCYLGRKLEFVLRNVDSGYVQRSKEDLATRHKKAFQHLGNHLVRKYPSIETDMVEWLGEHYGAEVAKVQRRLEQKQITFDTLLALDRSDDHFRSRFLAHLTTAYPELYGEIACYLRDSYPSALREVLRMTLRMTSHVKPTSVTAQGSAGESPAVPLQDAAGGKPPAVK